MICYSDNWSWGTGLLDTNYVVFIWRINRYQSVPPGSPCRLKRKVTHMAIAAGKLDPFGLQTTSRI
jgi:hypothetical protein